MVQDVRSSAGQRPSFDLHTEVGVLAVLLSVRQSAVPPATKNTIRDLVFAYRNSGGDQSLRMELEQMLAATAITAGVAAVRVTAPAAAAVLPAPRYGFSGSRPAPLFATPVAMTGATQTVVASRSISVPTPTPTPEMVDQPLPISVRKVPVKVIEPVIPVTDQTHTTPTATATPPPIPTLIPDPTPIPAAVIPTVTVTKDPTPPHYVPVVSVEPELGSTLPVARSRINDIKQLVNAKVGNAVNLIDRDNTVGREYMSALLEAMKAVGVGANMTQPMRRLEDSYKAVERMLATPPVAVSSVPVPELTHAPVATWSEPSLNSEPVTVPMPRQTAGLKNPQPVAPIGGPAEPISSAPLSVGQLVDIRNNVEQGPVAIAAVPRTPLSPVPSMSTMTPLLTPADLPTAQEKQASLGITDPLMLPDVDSGLAQLLGEWSLFKKSGMFGTGPKGRNHPLFITLSALPVSLIVTGRFDGATPEIKQSITDYMNGWRYEQGIIYEPDEVFEHYLRRVIHHIIQLQSGPRR